MTVWTKMIQGSSFISVVGIKHSNKNQLGVQWIHLQNTSAPKTQEEEGRKVASGSLSRPASHPQPAYLLLIESHATGRPGGPCSLHLWEETGWESNLGFSSPCCPRRARSCEGGLSKTGNSTLASPQCLSSLNCQHGSSSHWCGFYCLPQCTEEDTKGQGGPADCPSVREATHKP